MMPAARTRSTKRCSRPARSAAWIWLIAGVTGVGGMGLLPGCVTSGPPQRDPPKAIPTQPEGMVATVMSFNVGTYTADDNGNGFVDAFDATVYLFNDHYAFALAFPGTLTFTLQDRKGEALARWTFNEAQTQGLMRELPPGPGYLVRLSLLDVGGPDGDKFESQMAELTCEFVPRNGVAVKSKGGRPVRIGRIR